LPEIFAVPHFHFDFEWWKTREGYARDAQQILRKAVELLERYPEFKFTIDTFTAVEPVLGDRELVEKLRKFAQEGRVEFVGGTLAAPDENLPCGEALVRQFVLGRKKILREFGAECTTGWLIDEFGHTAQLPQILRKCGFRWLVFSRGIRWFERRPVDFQWEAPDGTRLLAHWLSEGYTFPAFPAGPDPLKQLEVQLSWEISPTGNYLVTVGGDFSVPREEWLEWVRRWNEGKSPKMRISIPREFLAELEKHAKALPVYRGELNPVFTGTYESRERVKKLCRETEVAILDTEKLSALALLLDGQYPDLEEEWENILLNNHHDLITGTGTDPVYRNTLLRYIASLRGALHKRSEALQHLGSLVRTRGRGDPLLVFNTLARERRVPVEVEGIHRVFSGEEELPVQYSEGKTIFVTELPPMGYSLFHLRRGRSRLFETGLHVRGTMIENEFYRVQVGPHGAISIFDREEGRELLDTEEASGGELLVEEDVGNLWYIRRTGRVWRDTYPTEVRVTERGPVRATVEISGEHHAMHRVQRVSLYSGVKMVFFETLIDFRGRDCRVRTLFPLALRGKVLHEVPFAFVERGDGHWPIQNWVGIREGEFGAYVLNRGIPSCEVRGNVISLGLFRSVSVLSLPFALHLFRNLGSIVRTLMRANLRLLKGHRYYEEYVMDHHYLMLREFSSPGPPVQLKGGVTIPDHLYPYFLNWRKSDAWERGSHRFSYALFSSRGGVEEATWRGLEFNTPPVVELLSSHDGELPPTKSFLSLSPSNVLLTTLKRAENGEGLVARVYECGGRETEFTLHFFRHVREAWKVSMDERERYEPLKVEGKVVRGRLSPHEICTILLRV